MKIEKGQRVKLKVELAVVGGPQLEKNTVEYVHGGGSMLPGLETVLVGLEKGAKREGVIKAKDAFGNPAMQPPLKHMTKSEFPAGTKLAVGETFVAKGVDGMNVIMKLDKIDGDKIEVRLVHPLAEKDISYKVEVVAVIDPRPPPMPVAALELDVEPDAET